MPRAKDRTRGGFLYIIGFALLQKRANRCTYIMRSTGCDVSTFCGKRKKSAWQIKDGCGEATGIYSKLSQCPTIVDDEDLKTLDKFLVMMYDRSSTAECVDDVGHVCSETVTI